MAMDAVEIADWRARLAKVEADLDGESPSYAFAAGALAEMLYIVLARVEADIQATVDHAGR